MEKTGVDLHRRDISVLGCTGSVGMQALDVAEKHGLNIKCISANTNVKAVENIARKFKPLCVAMADEHSASQLKTVLADTDIKIYSGENGICEMVGEQEKHTVINSIIGKAGLMPTLATIDAGHRLALANKESLVVAGDIVMSRAREKGVEVLPVDSEHCAIFQSLKSGKNKEIKKILLTASGGPFYGSTCEELTHITPEKALAHPTWKMGAKITIDSATLMNKGFEVIEAVHLFGVDSSQIQVVVHRESIIHSMVEYIDNSIIAQLSVPDMRLCVQYAVTYPQRETASIEELDLFSVSKLTFGKPDMNTFSLLARAYECIEQGGAMPCVLNAANEIAVDSFLKRDISFLGIFDAVEKTLAVMSDAKNCHTLDDIILADKEARKAVQNFLK